MQVVKPEHSSIVKALLSMGSVGAIHTCVPVVNVQHWSSLWDLPLSSIGKKGVTEMSMQHSSKGIFLLEKQDFSQLEAVVGGFLRK